MLSAQRHTHTSAVHTHTVSTHRLFGRFQTFTRLQVEVVFVQRRGHHNAVAHTAEQAT